MSLRAASTEVAPAVVAIPRHDWGELLARFSGMHLGWRLTAELLDGRGAHATLAREAPLAAIRLADHAIFVSFLPSDGDAEPSPPIRIGAPAGVELLETAEGAHRGLDVTTMDARRYQLRFRSAALPETVDGLP